VSLKISLTADDLETRPLPSFASLEMQGIFQCLAAASGAAEIGDDFDNDEDDLYKEDKWIHKEDNPPLGLSSISSPSSPLRQSSLSRLLESSIRSDYITLQPAENLGIIIIIINSSQGWSFSTGRCRSFCLIHSLSTPKAHPRLSVEAALLSPRGQNQVRPSRNTCKKLICNLCVE
jgi:hypothetical protein